MPGITTTAGARETKSLSVRVISIFALIAVASVACWPTSVALYEFWTDFENKGGTHGPLIVAASLWLIARNHARLASAPAQPSILAGAFLAAGSVAWLVALYAGIQDAHIVALPALIWLAAYAAFGRSVARLLAFPVAFSYFAVPAWSFIGVPLQWLTTHAVSGLIWITGLDAHVHGNFITIAWGTFEIAKGCSGLHFFEVGLAIAALWGELDEQTPAGRIKLMALMGAMAIVCNWIRVFALIVIGYTSQMKNSLITEGHYGFGWVLFAVTVVLFFWLAHRLFPLPAPGLAPEAKAEKQEGIRVGALAVAALSLVAGPALWGASKLAALAGSASGPLPELPAGKGVDSSWHPVFAGADKTEHLSYSGNDGHSIEAFLVAYRAQRQGAELVSETNSLQGTGFEIEQSGTVRSASGAYDELLVVGPRGRRSVIWSRYYIGRRPFTTPLASQLWYGVRAVAGPPVSSLVALRAECDSSCDRARKALESSVSTMEPVWR
jgi:EpsI family protein